MRKSSGEINLFDKRMGFHVNDSLNSRTIPHSILISSNLFTCAMLYYTAINHNSLLTFVSPHQPCNWTRIEVKWASGKKSRSISYSMTAVLYHYYWLVIVISHRRRYQFGRCEIIYHIQEEEQKQKLATNGSVQKGALEFPTIINQPNIINFPKSTRDLSLQIEFSLKLRS